MDAAISRMPSTGAGQAERRGSGALALAWLLLAPLEVCARRVQRRRDMERLHALPDRLLDDMGLSRDELESMDLGRR